MDFYIHVETNGLIKKQFFFNEADVMGCWINTQDDVLMVSVVIFQGAFSYLYNATDKNEIE